MAVEAESLSPSNLSAARQHVRTLSTREREALLRALLEQYESPKEALTDGRSHEKHPSRPRHAASASSISALSASIHDCPSLPEETEDDSIPGSQYTLPTALSPPPPQSYLARSTSPPTSASSIISTSTSWPARSASTSAVATTPSRQGPRQPPPHVRSHSTSHSALRSSFSTSTSSSAANRQTADSVALFHYRSKSYTASPEFSSSSRTSSEKPRKDKHVIGTATVVDIPAKSPPSSTTELRSTRSRPSMSSSVHSADTVFHGGLNILTPANADIVHGPATVENSPRNAKAPIYYWCTSCGDQFNRRSLWADHDTTCRATGRHNGRRKHPRPQRAWACGFCAAFLGSAERYQDHVAGHFERGKGLADWHYANVIYGLLHQPVVHKAWKRIWAARAAALPAGQRPKATWPSGCKFPTKRLDAFTTAPLAARKSSDTRDSNSNSTDSNGDEIIYIGLKEALEMFDSALESASVVVLHAESLAIFISVPTDEGSSAKEEASSSREKEKEREKSLHSKSSSLHRATSTTITAVSKPQTKTATLSKPPRSKAPAKTPASPPPAYTAAPLTLVTGRCKDDPLPALPLFASMAASLSPPSASPANTVTTTVTSNNTANNTANNHGKQRMSSVKSTALKPLNLFRSKDGESSAKQDKDKKFGKQQSKTAPLALGSSTTVTAGSPPNTTTYRPTYWADRPLPPLVNDNNYQGLSASASASPSSSPETQARLVAADHYTVPTPAGSLPSKRVENMDMDRMGTSYVDGFMASINAKRAVR